MQKVSSGIVNAQQMVLIGKDYSKVLVVRSWNTNTINVWDATSCSLNVIPLLDEYEPQIKTIEYRSGLALVYLGPTTTLLTPGRYQIWDFVNGKVVCDVSDPENILGESYRKFLIDASQRLLFSSNANSFEVWDVNTGKFIKKIKGENGLPDIREIKSVKNRLLIRYDRRIEIRDIHSYELINAFEFADYSFNERIIDENSYQLFCAYNPGLSESVSIRDIENGRVLKVLFSEGVIERVHFSGTEKRVVLLCKNEFNRWMEFWDIETEKIISKHKLSAHRSYVEFCFGEDDDHALTLEYENYRNQQIQVLKYWDSKRQYPVSTLDTVFNMDGSYHLEGGYNPYNNSLLRKYAYGAVVQKIDTRENLCAIGLHDAKSEEYSNRDGILGVSENWCVFSFGDSVLYKTYTKSASPEKLLTAKTGNIASLKIDKKSKKILTKSTGSKIEVWNAETGKLYYTLNGNKHGVDFAVWSGDGKYVITIDRDTNVRVWDGDKGGLARTLQHNGVKKKIKEVYGLIHDKYIITTSDSEVNVWDFETGVMSYTVGIKNQLQKIVCNEAELTFLTLSLAGEHVSILTEWRIETGTQVWSRTYNEYLSDFIISKSKDKLVLIGDDGILHLEAFPTLGRVFTEQVPGRVLDAQFFIDESVLCVASIDKKGSYPAIYYFYDSKTGKALYVGENKKYSVAFESYNVFLDGKADRIIKVKENAGVFIWQISNDYPSFVQLPKQEEIHSYDNNKEVNMYPNPSSQYISTDLGEVSKQGLNCELININGERIGCDMSLDEKGCLLINTMNMPNGFYTMRIWSNGCLRFGNFMVNK